MKNGVNPHQEDGNVDKSVDNSVDNLGTTASGFTCLCECHVGIIYPRNINIVYPKKCEHCQAKFQMQDVNDCLHDVYDIQERAIIQFILLGEPAKACRENRPPYAEVIELALPEKALTYEVKQLFESTWKFEKRDYGYEYFFSPPIKWDIKIPVRIYIYKGSFVLFDNPNRVWGTTEGFNIPNPFNDYWRVRDQVREKLEKGLPLSLQEFIDNTGETK